MKNDDGFIYEEDESLSDADRSLLSGLRQRRLRDPVTGRRQKEKKVLNQKNLTSGQLEEFMTEEMRLDF